MATDKSKEIQKDEELEQETQQETTAEPSMEDKYNELNDKYLRLYSEFDNYRRRTAKERLELFKNAGEEILSELLPVLDDFNRAIDSMSDKADISAISEGVSLVYNKLEKTLEAKGLKPFDAKGKIPAPKKSMKGKVVDVIETGYMLNDKVLRYAKVVVGE